MKKILVSLTTLLILSVTTSFAQDFTSGKELLKYYKDHLKELPSPDNGWYEAWVILPKEKEFVHEFNSEVVNAKVFLVEGEITKVFYDDFSYHESVYALGEVKKGKSTYQKVILNINSNLTEVFTAYTHTVIFKSKNEVDVPLDEYEKAGNMTFFSSHHKIAKQGLYVFVVNPTTAEYDFLGYLNKRCDDTLKCSKDDGLNISLLQGNYEIVAVQDKIQFNRQMPTKRYSVEVTQEVDHTLELIASN